MNTFSWGELGDDGTGMLDGDGVSQCSDPDVFADEVRGHRVALAFQADGAVPSHLSHALHLQQLAQLPRGWGGRGPEAMGRGKIAQAGMGPAVVVPIQPLLPTPVQQLQTGGWRFHLPEELVLHRLDELLHLPLGARLVGVIIRRSPPAGVEKVIEVANTFPREETEDEVRRVGRA